MPDLQYHYSFPAGKNAQLEECLRPLHAFYLAKKAELNACLIYATPLLAQERHR
jgi:hypothetical protein